jgi:lipid-binding SYLF domain-containing protein
MRLRKNGLQLILLAALALVVVAGPAQARTSAELQRDAEIALQNLYNRSPAAKKLSTMAKGILVFPNVIKGGFMVGGQYGEGALFINGKITGYYNSVAASYGLQFGAQSFGYTLFLMTDEALKYLETSEGLEIGMGPSVVVVDQGMASSMTTTTSQEDIYAFFFNQKGLMAGMGIQGSKISPIDPD